MSAQTVGVRELKARLSAYLRRVGNGERLTVTDHGRVVALLTPVDSPRVGPGVRSLVAEGAARWGGGKPTGMTPRLVSRGKAASEMVLEDRR